MGLSEVLPRQFLPGTSAESPGAHILENSLLKKEQGQRGRYSYMWHCACKVCCMWAEI